MAGPEEVVMIGLLLIMGCILGFLLLMSSSDFMDAAWVAMAAVKNTGKMAGEAIFGTTSTTTTTTTSSSSTSTTSSSTSTTTTSTSSTTTTTTSSTITTSTTSTTLGGRRCETPMDCGGDVVQLKCKGNSIYRFTTRYNCKNPGTPYSQCIGKVKQTVVESCEEYEDCRKGICMSLYLSECDMKCDLQYSMDAYCSDVCNEGDKGIRLSEWCNDEYRLCCCRD